MNGEIQIIRVAGERYWVADFGGGDAEMQAALGGTIVATPYLVAAVPVEVVVAAVSRRNPGRVVVAG